MTIALLTDLQRTLVCTRSSLVSYFNTEQKHSWFFFFFKYSLREDKERSWVVVPYLETALVNELRRPVQLWCLHKLLLVPCFLFELGAILHLNCISLHVLNTESPIPINNYTLPPKKKREREKENPYHCCFNLCYLLCLRWFKILSTTDHFHTWCYRQAASLS